MEEHFDILDKEGRPAGVALPRGQVHREGQWHACFHAQIVFRDPNGTPVGLFQKRAARKASFPSKYDATVTGHLSAGERVEDGVREIQEETGLLARYADLIPLGTRRWSNIWTPGRQDNEIHHAHLWPRVTRPEELHPDPEEVEGILALDLREGLRLMRGETEAIEQPYWICRRVCDLPGARATRNVQREDFVPTEDNYYARLMEIGLAWLEGRREEARL